MTKMETAPSAQPNLVAEALSFALALADWGRATLDSVTSGSSSSVRRRTDILTAALDGASIENKFCALVRAAWPDHGLIAGDDVRVAEDAEWVWCLSALDATSASLSGMSVGETRIALAHRGIPVLGVSDIAEMDSRWIGVANSPTSCNGRPCQVRPQQDMHNARMTISGSDRFDHQEEPALGVVKAQVSIWDISGSAAIAFGKLAQGLTDIVLDAGTDHHATAAFAPIVTGAGGVMTDWEGRAVGIARREPLLASSSAQLHEIALQQLASVRRIDRRAVVPARPA